MITKRTSTIHEPINIQELNYECIEHICSFLDIADLVCAALACPIFVEHCHECLEAEMLTSDIIEQISVLMDRTFFFATFGHLIKHLCITPFVEDYIDWLRLVGTYCPNVKSMRFHYPKLNDPEPPENEEVIDRPGDVSAITEMLDGPRREDRLEVVQRSHDYLLGGYWQAFARLAVLKLDNRSGCGPIQDLIDNLQVNCDLRTLNWMAGWLAENNIKIVLVEDEGKPALQDDRLAVVAASGATKRRLEIYNQIAEIKKKCSKVLTVILQR